MNIFAVLTDPKNDLLEQAIAVKFPDNFLKVGPGQFLIAAASTAVEVSKTLGLESGANGAAIVLSIASYFGRANPGIWDWLKTKWGNGA